jgi:ATP-dependent helicase/nuclease subunit A
MTVLTAKLADVEARRRILTDFGTTLFVEAAAGTGKTTVLVGAGLITNL